MGTLKTVGSYEIRSKLGEGGMGVVYLAEHPLIGRKAAVKVLLPQYSSNAMVVNRFFNEARAANLIKHPGIIDVFDFGQLPDGSAYIVMELLEGESLASRLDRDPRPPLPLVLEITRQLASAIGAAHAMKIIHRDLKPDNVFLVPQVDGPMGLRVKVLDFGIAKLTDGAALGNADLKTKTNSLLGTPLYMSPEQCRGASTIDHRSDIYALGCILFRMTCGVVPFDGASAGDILIKQATEPVPDIRALAPGLPEAVVRTIERALAKRADDRQATMAELVADLGFPLSGSLAAVSNAEDPTIQAPLPPRSVRAKLGAGTTLSESATQLFNENVRARPTSRRGLVAAGIALLGVGLAGGALWLSGRSHPVIAPKATPLSETAIAALVPSAPAVAPRVTLHISSRPAGAEVVDDAGESLGRTPLALTRDRGEGLLEVTVRLPGRRDAHLALPLARDAEELVTLAAAPAPVERKPVAPRVVTPLPEAKPDKPAKKDRKAAHAAEGPEALDPFAAP